MAMKRKRVPTSLGLLRDIVDYIKARKASGVKMSKTQFGKVVMSDPRFVHDLVKGRNVTMATYKRVQDWLDAQSLTIDR
jgi:hypothetical protein